ncbi:helix-turn-helix transcriptional regulator [Trichlorobacter sp.]|uniref:helix-turn-helix domain-containing protein n=1 Tax=Trichlorobacter sp. TaxID=2911007 RepID=UPI002A360433|nr:helix-turn-helix transcriptional regulator [Trichlorobacter sp.]MDY0385001.1 helix-turn-helix transcriptional regulator [Trichlorobacter sp.]
MDTTKKLFGARVKELRKIRGLSQEQLSELVMVDPKYISFIECGRNTPSFETMEKIAIALQVEIKDLFEFQHLQAGGVKEGELEQLLAGADEEKRKTLLKIVRAVVR